MLFALKSMKKADLVAQGMVENVRTEREILGKLNNRSLGHMHAAFHSPTNVFFLLDYADGGDLFDLLSEEIVLTESVTKHLIADCISGIHYLHSHGFIHRDIKVILQFCLK